MESGKAFELKKKSWEYFCKNCDEERKKTFKGGYCKKCKGFFKSSDYLAKMKRIPFPTQCMKCRQETINEEREKYYKAIFEKEEEVRKRLEDTQKQKDNLF